MSNTPRAAIAVPEFNTTGKRKIVASDRKPFKIDGEVYYLIRPKKSLIAQAAMALDNGASLDDAKNMSTMLGFVAQVIANIDDEPRDAKGGLHGRELIEHRLQDPRDALDIDDMLPVIMQIMNGWFNRPTKSPRASSAPRRTPSPARGSRVRTR